MRWKAQSRAVLAGGWASCCDRAIRIGSDRRGEEEEEEEEGGGTRERGGERKASIIVLQRKQKKEMKRGSGKGKVSEMKER